MVRSMLSESLRAVISQALLKKVGGGRTAAWEIMVGTPAIRNLIREDKVAQMYSAIQTGQQMGMMTLDQHLQDLVKRSLITATRPRNTPRTSASSNDGRAGRCPASCTAGRWPAPGNLRSTPQ